MRYVELHCQTNFTFLAAASHPEEVVVHAAELGYAGLAITDRNSLAGVVRAHGAALEAQLPLILGAELTPSDSWPVVAWATDRASYGRLSRLITLGRRRAAKGECQLTFADLAAHAAGLIWGVLPPDRRATERQTPASLPALLNSPEPDRYREAFGENCYLLAELHRGADDWGRLEILQACSHRAGVPLVAAGDVRYHVPARLPLWDVLTAIQHGLTVAEIGPYRLPNAQHHLRSLEDLAYLYSPCPAALARTLEIAERCRFSLTELRYQYPEELAPPGLTPLEYLTQLSWAGARERYPQGLPDKVRQLLEHELALIAELRYEAYFLTVWDLVRFARERGILCQGRGSAANSAVCFCLGITAVDPDRSEVLFERFISKERNEPPDIDVDFEHERREEVLQYLYAKYGRERAGLAATVITYRARSALRDVGKALGLSLTTVDQLAKTVEGHASQPDFAQASQVAGLEPTAPLTQRLVHLVREILGFPRHLSQHVGGMVMTHGPLCEFVPIENAAMPGRTVIQWDKDDLDALGLLKVDVLALGMLTAIRKCFALLEQHAGPRLTLADIPEGDATVYDMICRADTLGVFQIESRAQMSMLPRLKPRCFYDLVIEVALVRPGPIQGDMVHPYLRRRAGEEPVTYPNAAIEEVLQRTLGVPIFQEQAMRLAVVAAGFTPGEADQLRRAMAAWRRPGIIDQFRARLIQGMTDRGLSAQFAEQVFQQIHGFGEYGFPESHAASFALLVYVSSWLKCHYQAAFTAAMLNSQPLGFYAPSQLIRDAREHGVSVRPVHVNASHWDCTLEDVTATAADWQAALRLGFRQISGLAARHVETLVTDRDRHGPFAHVEDFRRRTGLSRAVLKKLAEADAFRELGTPRRQALWSALAQERGTRPRPLFADLNDDESPAVALPPLSPQEEILADYQTASLSLKGHPLACHRPALADLRVLTAAALRQAEDNQRVRVAGIVLLRQRPGTAKGLTFVTLEDETGVVNLIVHPGTWKRFHHVTQHSGIWLADGRLQSRESVQHVVVERLRDLSGWFAESRFKSRDFQ